MDGCESFSRSSYVIPNHSQQRGLAKQPTRNVIPRTVVVYVFCWPVSGRRRRNLRSERLGSESSCDWEEA